MTSKISVLVTGGAGFIGSNLVEALLTSDQVKLVRVLDNFSTGYRDNLKDFINHPLFELIEGDIRDYKTCLTATKGVDKVSHQAALGSVPRSINDPITSNEVNVGGTLNIFTAAKENKVERVIYAASSSTYGDSKSLPKKEEIIGNPLSPYAVTKYVNELYANVFARLYGMKLIGLRYFNVFGPKQNPFGPYAAVIPLFVTKLMKKEAATINGDGLQSRDFTYVANAVQANIKAMFADIPEATSDVFNIAYGQQTTLLDTYNILQKISGENISVIHGPERAGDVKHSLADITKAASKIGYQPEVDIEKGLALTYQWFKNNYKG